MASYALTLFDNTLIPAYEGNGVFSPDLELSGFREMSIFLVLWNEVRSQMETDGSVVAWPYWYLLTHSESFPSDSLGFGDTSMHFFHMPVHGPKAMIRVTNSGAAAHRMDGFLYAV